MKQQKMNTIIISHAKILHLIHQILKKLEKSIFNQDENKKIAQDMIDSIDLNQADKDLQEELNIEFPDPSKNYLATGEVNGDVENEDGPYPF